MSLTLPTQIQDVFDRFITTEYVTVDAKGQPIAWPVTPYFEHGQATIDVTTGIGYPKKADDAARHPRVALLFSDPTGSGLDAPPQVLVQGTADVDEADLKANRDRYRREALEKLPATKDMMPPKFVEGLLGWYFDRIYVKTTPERVFAWPAGDATATPEVHGGRADAGSSQPAAVAAKTTEEVWDERIDELGSRYDSAVLAWVGADGYPLAARLPVSADAGSRRIRLGAEPAGLPAPSGLACVTAHSHGPRFEWQENFQVRGELERTPEGLALVPRKMVGGFELPDESQLAGLRRNFKKARRFHKISKERRKAREGS
jgi:pyridoxamine 5'-phosphate oxidase-like protein